MPQYRVVWLDQAAADLSRLDRAIAKRVFDVILRYSRTNSGDVTVLRGAYAGTSRLRAGDYRIFFRVEDGAMRILGVRHRSWAYR